MLRIIFLLAFLPSVLFAESVKEPYQMTAEVKEGEGLFAFMRRYALNNACNINEFYRLNKLDKNQHLIANREYILPVKIYDYDGRSIRSSIKIDEWERAVKIKEYNEHILKKGARSTHYADSKILWVPYHLMECYTRDEIIEEKKKMSVAEVEEPVLNEEIVVSKSEKINALFGPAYEKYEQVDQSLSDKVYYIVSGHGGPDPGAVCTSCKPKLCEDEYAYDVALRLARNLSQHGAKVEMIIQDKNDGIRDNKYLKCDYDERCNGNKLPLNNKKRLYQRVEHINTLHKKYKKQGFKEHIVVVIHVDAAGTGSRRDVFFYHHKTSKASKRLANNIHKTFQAKYDKFQKGRGYKGTVRSRGLYMLNYTNPPTVFIELANIQNPADQKRILINSNRQALANWLFEGLIAN